MGGKSGDFWLAMQSALKKRIEGHGLPLPAHCGPFAGGAPCPERTPKFVLLSLPQTARTESGRRKVRQAIQATLENWIPDQVALTETPTGPEIEPLIQGKKAYVSISYAGSGAWIAISLGERIGLDAVSLDDCEGWREVAAIYLKRKISELNSSANPKLAFAHAWASMEAALKRVGLPLSEDAQPQETVVYSWQQNQTVLAIAFD